MTVEDSAEIGCWIFDIILNSLEIVDLSKKEAVKLSFIVCYYFKIKF